MSIDIRAVGYDTADAAALARFWSEVSDGSARRLLRASFVYLPAILMLLLLNPMPA